MQYLCIKLILYVKCGILCVVVYLIIQEGITMKKTIIILLAGVLLLMGCGKPKQDTKALKEYEQSMTTFFNDLVKIDQEINSIDPESDTSISELFKEFDALQTKFEYLAEVPVPKDLIYWEAITSRAAEGKDYMVQANDYFKQSFTETSYNPNYLEAAMESYRRANKRVQYIISLIHGVVPQDA